MTRTASMYESGPALVYAHQQNKVGQIQCGDRYAVVTRNNFSLFVVADGLGSGPGAAESSRAAIEAIKDNATLPLEELIQICNKQLLYKRGVALAIMKLWHDTLHCEYVSVGNVRLSVFPNKGKVIYPLSTSGYLSGRPFQFKLQPFIVEKGFRFLLYSDGMQLPSSKLITDSKRSFELTVHDVFTQYATSKDDASLLAGIIECCPLSASS